MYTLKRWGERIPLAEDPVNTINTVKNYRCVRNQDNRWQRMEKPSETLCQIR